MALPSGGLAQTKPPSQTQLEYLERETGLDCSRLNCTMQQASFWLGCLWEQNRTERKRLRLQTLNHMIRLGARE